MELMAVMVVAGLAAGLVTVSMARLQDKSRFRAAVADVAASLRTARNKAILDRTRCTFFFEEPDADREGPDDRVRFGFACDAGLSKTKSLPKGLFLEGVPIAFFPKGYSSGGTITVRDDQRYNAIVAVHAVTGQVYVTR